MFRTLISLALFMFGVAPSEARTLVGRPSISIEISRQRMRLAQFALTTSPDTVTSSTTFSPPSGHNYLFMRMAGSDTYCNGTANVDDSVGVRPRCAWASPNHALSCGDVIVAASGNYTRDMARWGTVSNCPSTSGGIDGMGGIYAAVLLCGGSDLNSCVIDCATAACNAGYLGTGGRNAKSAAMNVNSSYWSIQGWTAKGGGYGHRGFQVDACLTTTTLIHHVSFINDVVSNAATGFNTNDCGYGQSVPGNGVDYWGVWGSIAQNAAQDPICVAAIDAVGMANVDTKPGTHLIFDGNFSYNNRVRCVSDGENFMFDTLDAHGFQGLVVARNNVGWLAERFGFQIFNQKLNASFAQTIKVYQNTMYSDCAGQNSANTFTCGDFNIATVSPGATIINSSVTLQNNIGLSAFKTGGNVADEPVYALALGGVWKTLTIGGSGPQNVFKAIATACPFACDSKRAPFNVISSDGSSLGANTYTNPTFGDATDLISNQSGAPNCTGFENVVQCMGYDAATNILRTPSVISDIISGCAGCAGKGYQKPKIQCLSPASFPDFPGWAKGLIYLHWNGSLVQQKAGLTDVPCGE